MKSTRSYRTFAFAGLAAILATTAVAQETGVWFRGTDGQSVRSAQERAPHLEFPAATNLLLGGTALSAPALFSGPAGPVRLQASGGEIRICDDAACSTPGAWGAAAAARSGQFVQVSRSGPRSPGETVRVTVEAAGLTAAFDASARLSAPGFGAFSPRTVSPGDHAESDLSTFHGWIESDLTVTGGSVRICPPQGHCGAWSTSGTIRDGDQIQLRGEAGAFGTTRTVTASAGGAEGAFGVVTREKNTTPAAFSFGPGLNDLDPGTATISPAITLAGFDDAPISVAGTGSTYSLNGASYTTAAGTAKAGDTVRIRIVTGAFGETRTATVTVGGTQASWSASTRSNSSMYGPTGIQDPALAAMLTRVLGPGENFEICLDSTALDLSAPRSYSAALISRCGGGRNTLRVDEYNGVWFGLYLDQPLPAFQGSASFVSLPGFLFTSAGDRGARPLSGSGVAVDGISSIWMIPGNNNTIGDYGSTSAYYTTYNPPGSRVNVYPNNAHWWTGGYNIATGSPTGSTQIVTNYKVYIRR